MSPPHCPNCQLTLRVDDIFPQESTATYQKKLDNLLHRCRSNDVPDSSLAKSALESDAAVLESEIQTYDDAITKLQMRREQLTKLRDCIKSLVSSPIRKIPEEIMEQIVWFVIDHHPDVFNSSAGCRGPIFPLTWVCSSWRRLIIFRNAFWSSFSVEISSDAGRTYQSLKESLLRSGSVIPIDIKLSIDSTSEDLSCFDLLTEYTRRWRSLDLEYPHVAVKNLEHIFKTTLSSSEISDCFPLLEVLKLSGDDLFEQPFGRPFIHFPRLHTLHIDELHANKNGVDLRNLTRLRIEYAFNGGSLASLLNRCPLLQELSVGSIFPNGPESFPTPSIDHSHLSLLHIRSFDRCSPDALQAGSLRLSTLREIRLRLSEYYLDDIKLLRKLKEMIVLSECTLKSVSLEWYRADEDISWFFRGIRLEPDALLVVDNQPYSPPQ